MRVYRQLAVGLVTTSLLACTVMQPLSISATRLQTELHPGDAIQITTNSGREIDAKVSSIDAQAIHTQSGDFDYNDISQISRKQISAGRTALLVLGIAAGGALAAGGSSGGGGMGGY